MGVAFCFKVGHSDLGLWHYALGVGHCNLGVWQCALSGEDEHRRNGIILWKCCGRGFLFIQYHRNLSVIYPFISIYLIGVRSNVQQILTLSTGHPHMNVIPYTFSFSIFLAFSSSCIVFVI